ncbi:MAG: GntR family transcriptional regulator [Clostridiaceae bacterium]|nr:GntR family transcriptional regulator [Clostridiaceae bacterium]
MKSLIKEKGAPYYLQIKEILEERIFNNVYPVNSLMPSETTLAEEFDVTRTTIRNALKELKNVGLIYTEKGKGTIIKSPKIEQSLLNFYSFGREFKDSSHNIGSKVISKEKIVPTLDLIEKLQVDEKTSLFKIERLRLFNNIPMILETSYIPEDVAQGIIDEDLENKSIYDLLEWKYKVKIAKAQEYIEPKIANVIEAGLLEIPKISPVFYTERITLAAGNKPVELRMSIIRGDKFKFYTELY